MCTFHYVCHPLATGEWVLAAHPTPQWNNSIANNKRKSIEWSEKTVSETSKVHLSYVKLMFQSFSPKQKQKEQQKRVGKDSPLVPWCKSCSTVCFTIISIISTITISFLFPFRCFASTPLCFHKKLPKGRQH